MGDLGDYWRDLREWGKERRAKRNSKYEPMLIEIGAIEKSSGIYEYKDWLCYPTKGFAMNKRDYSIRTSLRKLLESVKND